MISFKLPSQLKFALKPANDSQFSIQTLLNTMISRLRQRRKLILLLAACLCFSVPANAHFFSPLLNILLPNSSVITNEGSVNKSSNDNTINQNNIEKNNAKDKSIDILLDRNNLPPVEEPPQFGEYGLDEYKSDDYKFGEYEFGEYEFDNYVSDSAKLNEPSLYALLDAEFAASRGNTNRALTLYKQQSFKKDSTAVFERALGLSLRNENVESSLQFAKAWQDQNPDHVPAWFYVAHLALKAQDYRLAGATLNRILSYDPRADLSEILIGIYPNTDDDQRELLAALQPIDSEQNASLSVLKAGLLYQFNEPQTALIHINRALMRQPNYVPFITLKADILRKIEPSTSNVVINYINQARLRNPDNKNLYLYEIRYLLDLQRSQEAWELLLDAHNRFTDDAEITLLAALVSLDIEEYRSADRLLNVLVKSPAYLDQAYYYLGISAERQQRFEQAKSYLNAVMREDLVLAAREKVVAFELLDDNVDAALATLDKLRKQFEVFAPDSYVMQADILLQQNQANEALQLLTRASQKYPDSETILFARVQLLDDVKDYIIKRPLLNHLQALDPNNLSYKLSYAQLLLSNDTSSEKGLELANAVIQIRYDDPRYDNELHLQALNVLASNALANENYTQVIDYLQTPYDVLPTLRSGVLLLRAYQGLNDSAKVNTLLADLQQRFSFGQDNINDRVQLY